VRRRAHRENGECADHAQADKSQVGRCVAEADRAVVPNPWNEAGKTVIVRFDVAIETRAVRLRVKGSGGGPRYAMEEAGARESRKGGRAVATEYAAYEFAAGQLAARDWEAVA
jgi:hypothetical protein